MNEYKEYLNIAVIQESKPVTYKALARSLGINVNTAKQALLEFSTENKNNVHAIYSITGQTLSSDQFTIKLVKASDVEETKKIYRQVTGLHVYSVAAFDTNDFSLLYPACKDIPKLTLEDRIKTGILKNKNVTMKAPKTNRQREIKKPLPPPVQKSVPVKPISPTNPAQKRKGTLSFAPVEKSKTKTETTADHNRQVAKPASKLATKSTENVVKKPISNMFGQVKKKIDQDDIEARMAKTSIKIEDIFSDEEEEEEPQPQEPQEADAIELEDDLMEEAEQTKEEEKKEEKEEEEEAEASSSVSCTPGKAKRKVLRKKTTKNARGFLVTEEVWEWEEVDESELPKPKPMPSISVKPKATTNNKSTSKKTDNSKKTAQTNLFSFFKKN